MYRTFAIGLILVGVFAHWSGCAEATSDTETSAVSTSSPLRSGRGPSAADTLPDTPVGPVPRRLREARDLSAFYEKHIDCGGLPVLASQAVRDAALVRACEIVTHMLAGRDDVRQTLVKDGVRIVIIGEHEFTTDIPEYSHMKPKVYWDERARGFGGRIVSCGEENLLCLPIDRYDDENILVHEFGHCMHGRGLSRVDAQFNEKLKQLYDKALAQGLWKDTYAATNPAEYWAEAVQSYFDCNRQNNWNHNHVNTRREMYEYDPELAEFVAKAFALTDDNDWRYVPLAGQPGVTTPPASLDCHPFYTKYVDCRSLPILGSEKTPDEAMLRANSIIRNMFAYRHDILKAMIDDGLRVVVLGAEQRKDDLPRDDSSEYNVHLSQRQRARISARQLRLVVCSEKNLGEPSECLLIRDMAKAICHIVGMRPVDEQFDNKPRKQQYELRVQRIDKRFDDTLRRLYAKAIEKGLWKDTAAAASRVEYWAEGVQSWFDCNAESPAGEHNRVNTREELESYDPDLAALVAEVFQHAKHALQEPAGKVKQAKTADDHLDAMSQKSKELQSFQCKLDYVFRQPVLFDSREVRQGSLWYAKYGDKSKLRVNFDTLKQDEEPQQKYAEHFIFDGTWLTTIDYQLKSVEKRQLAEADESVDAFDLVSKNMPIVGFTKVDELHEHFKISLVEQPQEATAETTTHGDAKSAQLRFVPKEGSPYSEDYTTIDLWVDTQLNLPVKIVAVTSEEDVYEIRLLEPKVNEQIDEAVFEFKIPRGFGEPHVIPLEETP